MEELLDSLAARTSFMQYLIAICNRFEVASDAISGRFVRPNVPDKCVRFTNPYLDRSREIPPKAIGGSILTFLR